VHAFALEPPLPGLAARQVPVLRTPSTSPQSLWEINSPTGPQRVPGGTTGRVMSPRSPAQITALPAGRSEAPLCGGTPTNRDARSPLDGRLEFRIRGSGVRAGMRGTWPRHVRSVAARNLWPDREARIRADRLVNSAFLTSGSEMAACCA